jgi:hypothetical protein
MHKLKLYFSNSLLTHHAWYDLKDKQVKLKYKLQNAYFCAIKTSILVNIKNEVLFFIIDYKY